MLTSDFQPYSETDSLISSTSSEYLSSEIDSVTNENITNLSMTLSTCAKKRSKSRSQKKVKYWTLPTMSSGTFNPSMLTARQQLQYLAQKSKLGEESESLELSPLRLDRIKFEEMRSMSLKEQENCTLPNQTKPQMLLSLPPGSPLSTNLVALQMPTSPSNGRKQRPPSSKLTESVPSDKKVRKPNMKRRELLDKLEDRESADEIVTQVRVDEISLPQCIPTLPSFSPVLLQQEEASSAPVIAINNNSKDEYAATFPSNVPKTVVSVTSPKNFAFNYQEHRGKHFENFLKDFAKRMGKFNCVEEEMEIIVQRKREEIINKGMI